MQRAKVCKDNRRILKIFRNGRLEIGQYTTKSAVKLAIFATLEVLEPKVPLK